MKIAPQTFGSAGDGEESRKQLQISGERILIGGTNDRTKGFY
jgi:hypothetical protein